EAAAGLDRRPGRGRIQGEGESRQGRVGARKRAGESRSIGGIEEERTRNRAACEPVNLLAAAGGGVRIGVEQENLFRLAMAGEVVGGGDSLPACPEHGVAIAQSLLDTRGAAPPACTQPAGRFAAWPG